MSKRHGLMTDSRIRLGKEWFAAAQPHATDELGNACDYLGCSSCSDTSRKRQHLSRSGIGDSCTSCISLEHSFTKPKVRSA